MLAHRTHEFHMGHRILGHQGKCIHPHGHSYIVTFYVEAPKLDSLGMVTDFSVIKDKLVNWIEENIDHKFMVSKIDPLSAILENIDPAGIVIVPFNPTAENIAAYLLYAIGPQQLEGTGVELVRVNLMETGKCGVTVDLTEIR